MKSPRFRYGLRTFLATLMLVAIVACYYGNQWNLARLQAEAIEAIKSAGGLVVQNKEEGVTRVLFRGKTFDDESLKEMARYLKYLPELHELDFVSTKITDDSIEHLLRVKQMNELYLFETGITEKGINELNKRMPHLVVKREKPEPISSGMAAMNVYNHALVGLDWTPDGNHLATGSADGIIRLWDFETNSPAHQWQAHENWAFSVAFSPDGRIIATGGGDNLVKLWNAASRELIAELHGHTDDVHSVVFTPDGTTLASAGDDCEIRFWDLKTRKTVKVLKGHQAQIPSITIGPNGKFMASASRDNTVRLWDMASGETVAVLPTSNHDVNTVAFDSNGEFLASGDQGGKVSIWDLQTRQLVTRLEGHNGKVYRIAFNRDANSLASCGDDGIRMWDLSTSKSYALGRSQQYVSNIAFHPKNELLASTNAGGELQMVDINSRRTLLVIQTAYGKRGFDFDE